MGGREGIIKEREEMKEKTRPGRRGRGKKREAAGERLVSCVYLDDFLKIRIAKVCTLILKIFRFTLLIRRAAKQK